MKICGPAEVMSNGQANSKLIVWLSFSLYACLSVCERVGGCGKSVGKLLGGTATRGGADSWLVIAALSN